ncbi:MAG: hypothetical protein WKG03_03425 [Telluria sp.]
MNEAVLMEFDKSMGSEESFWHDFNLEVSSELLARFSEHDWKTLEKNILARPLYWQERCAEAIGYMDNEEGVATLTAFLESPHLSVAAIAASELDNMGITLPGTLRSRLLKIQEYVEANESARREDIHNLIARLA